MASRSSDSLIPSANALFLDMESVCNEEGLDVLWYCFHRPLEEQAILYRQGRTLERIKRRAHRLSTDYGRSDLAEILMSAPPQMSDDIVTWAAPGQSMHNYRMAGDGVPLLAGKPIWLGKDTPQKEAMWQHYGKIAVEVGLKWAGNWSKNKEYPHCQQGSYGWREKILTYDFNTVDIRRAI